MGDAALSALNGMLSVQFLTSLLIGISVGFLIGLIPGLGGSVGLAIALPFTFGMDPIAGIALLIGLSSVNDTTCSYPAILIGVPGSGGSTATVLDGYPMSKKGEGARALGASFSASMLGGIFGAAALLAVILLARNVVGALGSPELFMLTVLGLASVGVIVSGDALLGLASAAVGLMLGTIGSAPATAERRYDFGSLYLGDGLSIVIVTIGIFAVAEVIAFLVAGDAVAKATQLTGSVWSGFRETWRHKMLVLRSSWLGTLMGAIPGMGGSVVDEMAYAMARMSAKDSREFGKGDVRGVIAPEAANNAKEGGGLIPTLILGIPSGASAAVLLGGLILMGVTPGPPMLGKYLDVTLTVVWTLVIANILVTTLCLIFSKQVARVTLVPGRILGPLLIVVFFAAGYQNSAHFGDILAILGIGLFGYVMKVVGWPRVPFVVGFVLAAPLERYLHLSMSRYHTEWFTRPLVILLAVGIVFVTVVVPIYRYLRKSDDRGTKAYV